MSKVGSQEQLSFAGQFDFKLKKGRVQELNHTQRVGGSDSLTKWLPGMKTERERNLVVRETTFPSHCNFVLFA
jgi:hypothetical protein